MVINGSWQGSHADNVTVDLDHLSNSCRRTLSYDQPGTLDHQAGITSFIDEGPRQTGIVLAVQVDHKIDSDLGLVAHPSSTFSRWYGFTRILCSQELGDAYRQFAATRKRLVPFVW